MKPKLIAIGLCLALAVITPSAGHAQTPNWHQPNQLPMKACSLTYSPVPFNLNGKTYMVSRETFSPSDNITQIIKSAYGETAELADWNELKRALTTPQITAQFIEATGLPLQSISHLCGNFIVRAGPYERSSGTRDVFSFIARLDGRVPYNWAVIDSIGPNIIDLGRWYYRSQALVTTEQPLPTIAQPQPQTQPPLNKEEYAKNLSITGQECIHELMKRPDLWDRTDNAALTQVPACANMFETERKALPYPLGDGPPMTGLGPQQTNPGNTPQPQPPNTTWMPNFNIQSPPQNNPYPGNQYYQHHF